MVENVVIGKFKVNVNITTKYGIENLLVNKNLTPSNFSFISSAKAKEKHPETLLSYLNIMST